MKAKLKSATYFLIGLLCFDAIVFMIMMKATTIFKSEDFSVAKHYPESDIIVIGTSHAAEGFSPKIIQHETKMSCYNLGRARRNVEYNYYMTRYLIKKGRKPKLVFLVNTYHDLTEMTKPYLISSFAEDPDELIELTGLFALQKEWVPGRQFFYCDRYSASIRMMFSRGLGWMKNRQTEIPFRLDENRGFSALAWHMEKKEEKKGFETFRYRYEERKLTLLIKTIRLWKEAGVQVILCDPPEFIGTRLSRIEYDRYEQKMHEVAKATGSIYRSFNQPNLEIMKNHRYFKDGDWGYPNSHLNVAGAEIFSKMFVDWLKRENLLPKPNP